MSFNENIKLNDGNTIPAIGLGTWLSKPGEVKNAVIHAVKSGYRHLDLAKIYQNQTEIGEALKEVIPSVVKREDLFITSKLWNSQHKPKNVESALDDTLKELGLDYLDLYLIHWPVAFETNDPNNDLNPKDPSNEGGKFPKFDLETSLVDTWKAMIDLKKTGKVKSIGVSNFTTTHLEGIIQATGVTPSVNQIEAHPLLPQDDLVKFSNLKGIHITAYSPLGNKNQYGTESKNDVLTNPNTVNVAKKLNADPAQVLIAWGRHRGYSVIPKSVTPSRIELNFKQIKLSDEDYNTISNVMQERGTHLRFNIPVNYPWNFNVFSEKEEVGQPHTVKVGAGGL